MPEQEEKETILKISSDKDPGYVKRVAGAMGWQLREKGYCKARAVKADAVNTAVKAVAIVNQRVSKASRAGSGLVFETDLFFSQTENDKTESTAIAMTVQEADSARPETFMDYKVGGHGDTSDDVVTRLAGAMAPPLREGKGVRLRCIGPGAVYRAIRACATAKGYVYPNGIALAVVPQWATMTQGSKAVSLISIEVWGRTLAS
jgi:stage V sporulation protein SpoVS